MADEPASDGLPPLSAAEAVLAASLGGSVRLEVDEILRERGRNRVVRCRVSAGPPKAPASVIVKAAVGEDNQPFDAADGTHEGPAWRLFNEWASTRFLDLLPADPPLGARLLGGDRTAGLLVLEDLGPGQALADVLQGDDRGRTEEALLSYAASLGRMHALTAGRDAAWARLRSEMGGGGTPREPEGVHWLREAAEPFRAQCEALEVPLARGFDEEARAVQQTLSEPGAFLAFTPGDTCPDNHRLIPEGYLRFFDFEFSCFRHALLDAAYFYAPFPTCWCVNRLPRDLTDAMERVYRTELVQGCTQAAEDGFPAALSHACAFWTITTLKWGLEAALKEDHPWGIATLRQRHLLRLENFAERAERLGHLPAISDTARALAAKLKALWPEVPAMPLYPPLRAAAGKDGP